MRTADSPSQLADLHDAKILIIDDEQVNVRMLERFLKRAGFEKSLSTTDPREAAALFQTFQPDLILTDWIMPHLDGAAVIEQLTELMSSEDYLPIIVLTADITPQTRQCALAAGATDFLTKPLDHVEVLLRITNLLRARRSQLRIQEHNSALEDSVRIRTIDLERALADLRSTQAQVIQQERLAALGTMAGGIAHDFNNSLSIIMGFGERLLRETEQGRKEENAVASLRAILSAAGDAAKIVHRLREFHSPNEFGDLFLPVELNELVKQAIALTQPRWQGDASASAETVTVTTELEAVPAVAGHAAELREALTNLIFNATDAMPGGGTITLRTFAKGDFVYLQVTDTGHGMSSEVRAHCLEPFFTTKGTRGTGLGLSMVYGIIQRHGGVIEIESEPREGSTFTIRLPAMTGSSLLESNATREVHLATPGSESGA